MSELPGTVLDPAVGRTAEASTKKAIDTIGAASLDAAVDGLLNRHPAVGLAVGVVRDGDLVYFRGHGYADVASHRPITDDTVFRVASITKTFTAVAIMQLWEQGLIDLDAPAHEYLHSIRLRPARADFGPVTVRHLLTHTSGIAELRHPWQVFRSDFGESVSLADRLPDLAEYYATGLPVDAEPGTHFAYSDHGFAVLGQLVEDVSRTPLHQYFREEIFLPLGMHHCDLRRSRQVRNDLATGYTVGSHGPVPVVDREWITTGASSIYASSRDMACYLAAMLGGGANRHGRILKPDTLRQIYAPQYQPDPRIAGVGMAFSRFENRGHLLVEHGGVLPGFNSDIFLAPDDGVGVMAFTNGARGAMLWLPGAVGSLLNQVMGMPDPVIREDIPQRPEIWPTLLGRYLLPGRLSDFRARSMMGAGASVIVRGGRLVMRVLSPIPEMYHGFELHPDDPDDPYVFRIDLNRHGIGTGRIVFSSDPGRRGTELHFDLFPISARKSLHRRTGRPVDRRTS
jgi:CubicO group peptidase (beta-lactamase class C family)